MMQKIAVTGGIAEGKSTVVGYLRDLGMKTASSDEISRQVFLSEPVQIQLAGLLGMRPPVTPPDLRERLFENSDLRRKVNSLMHPAVLESLRRSDAEVIEVPLLIETCLQGEFRRVWVVTCGPEEQRRRLRERVGAEADVEAILQSQLPTEVKAAFADVIVRTNRPSEDVIRFIKAKARRPVG